jgi:hypothetical protein
MRRNRPPTPGREVNAKATQTLFEEYSHSPRGR